MKISPEDLAVHQTEDGFPELTIRNFRLVYKYEIEYEYDF